MELIERKELLAQLQVSFETITNGEGHCVLLSGEAGIGKTSLVRAFCRELKNDCRVYQGTCDALFTPRPLAPLYDIALQIDSDIWQTNGDVEDRAGLFTRFLHEIGKQAQRTVIIFEDIHWADEATLDFIKFFARRINRMACLFILTYRDDEIHAHHPLRSVLGQLPAHTFTRLPLQPLSRQAVEKLAVEKGYSGEDVYSISAGNPFYVNEILASYSPGVPENIKDAVLSVYNRLDEKTKQVWEILSVLPTGVELNYLEQLEPAYATAIESSLDARILLYSNGLIFFKHELYRRTIEASLSPLVSIGLNQRILDLFLPAFESNRETERIIHHAKNAHRHDLVVHYAPLAAKQAALVGSHIEASKLYFSAINHYTGDDAPKLICLYEAYAYECYLINQVREAIRYQQKALDQHKTRYDVEKTGNCMRFLSRLWWFEGNRTAAEKHGEEAVKVLNDQPSSSAKAMAYSNMSQLKMLADQPVECVYWGEKAIAIAKELGDDETLSHALNNVGTVRMEMQLYKQLGVDLLQQSLDLALKHSYHEHAARAYTNQASSAVKIKDYAFARQRLEAGIDYCEKLELDSWTAYMLSHQARLNLETGNWDKALCIALKLVANSCQTSIVKLNALTIIAKIKMRRGGENVLPLLMEAKEKAFKTMELQRIIPVLVAILEYEWLSGEQLLTKMDIDCAISMSVLSGNVYENSEFAFWLHKARKQRAHLREYYPPYVADTRTEALRAAQLWEEIGCPYEQALTLFEGTDADKRRAIAMVQKLGADAIYQKMKQEMQNSGIKSIPRGIRSSTRSNPAHLTEREKDVLHLLKDNLQNKEIASRLFISAKTVDHHISSILLKLDVNTRGKAVQEAAVLGI
jgi:DNA-binding CsgD family transcriptional regulator